MIKVYENDTIIDVVNKINNCEDKELLIEFPFGHNILNNYMSLKILKNKAGNKKITILTNDIISKKIGIQLGINYSILKDSDFHKEKNFKQELLKHNFTFIEYFIFIIKKYLLKIINFLGKKTGLDTFKYYNPYNKVKKTGVVFLTIGLITSILMLIFIFYFAVSKTYIEIIPEITIKTRATNIIYEEIPGDISMVSNDLKTQIKKVKEKINLNYTHKTTGIDYENTLRASGEVIFINELKEEQTFRPKTRLLNKDGIVFETLDWIKIPGKTVNGSGETIFGTTKSKIIAKIYDANGEFIGSKGNLTGEQLFTIPGLKFSQDKIYAKLIGQTKGGNDNIIYVVGEKDIDNSKKILEGMLKKEAINALKKRIEEDNKTAGVTYEILPIPDLLKYDSLDIKTNPKEIKFADKLDSFSLSGTITVETYIYNKNAILNILRNIINESLLTGTDKLISIDENSLRMTVIIEKKESPLSIKATTEIDIGISYDFNNNSNYYNQRLKTLILGLSNDEAKNILINEERISDVNIKNTPFFVKKISSNIENIIMKIVER